MTWKNEMDQKEEILRLEHIQKKKIEMELSREEAILAQERKTQANRLNANQMMIAASKRMDERDKNAKEEFGKKLVTVDQVHSQKDKASEACEAQKVEKREIRN